MGEVSKTTKAGQDVRLATVPADAGCGYGMFETLHGAQSAKELADKLVQASARYHGTAGIAFAFLETFEDETRAAERWQRLEQCDNRRRQRHTVLAFRLRALGWKGPERHGQIEFRPCGVKRITGTCRRQDREFEQARGRGIVGPQLIEEWADFIVREHGVMAVFLYL